MDTVKAVNTLNAVNLGLGGAMNGCSESFKHSECYDFGTWWCYECPL